MAAMANQSPAMAVAAAAAVAPAAAAMAEQAEEDRVEQGHQAVAAPPQVRAPKCPSVRSGEIHLIYFAAPSTRDSFGPPARSR